MPGIGRTVNVGRKVPDSFDVLLHLLNRPAVCCTVAFVEDLDSLSGTEEYADGAPCIVCVAVRASPHFHLGCRSIPYLCPPG